MKGEGLSLLSAVKGLVFSNLPPSWDLASVKKG